MIKTLSLSRPASWDLSLNKKDKINALVNRASRNQSLKYIKTNII